MRLCCVDHYRCDEVSAHTYVWCEQDWSEEQFQEAVDKAEKAYNLSLKEYSDVMEKDPFPEAAYRPKFEDYPDMLVADIIANHEEKIVTRNKWKALKTNAQRPFSRFLLDEGLVDFYDVEAEYETTIWWGHRHSERLDYEDNSPWTKDLKEQAKPKTRRRVVKPLDFL